MGAEKFFDIKCRKAGFKPDATVLVATIRALKYHGGQELKDLGTENVEALKKGCNVLERHVKNLRRFGVPVIVGINRFSGETVSRVHPCARNPSPILRHGGPHCSKGGLKPDFKSLTPARGRLGR